MIIELIMGVVGVLKLAGWLCVYQIAVDSIRVL